MAKLAELVKTTVDAAKKQGVGLKQLASDLDCTTPNINQVVGGTTIPEAVNLAHWLPTLQRFANITSGDVASAYLHDQVERDLDKLNTQINGEKDKGKRKNLEEMAGSLRDLLRAFPGAATARGNVRRRVLTEFPAAFLPLTIVSGDKRESPPKTVGDLAAYSASPCDDRFLCALGLPRETEKISDKVFVQADADFLQRRFGHTNLLVVGSPASNHLARIINSTAIFRFKLDDNYVRQIETILREGAREASRHSGLQRAQENNADILKFVMRQMFSGGIFDPTYQFYFRAATAVDRDYGVVSLARNPYAKADSCHVAIMVAGIHLPATMAGLKLLAEPEKFRGHEWGGVYEVETDKEILWHERLESLTPTWDRRTETTGTSELDRIVDGLDRIVNDPSHSFPAKAAVEDALKFVRELQVDVEDGTAGMAEGLKADRDMKAVG